MEGRALWGREGEGNLLTCLVKKVKGNRELCNTDTSDGRHVPVSDTCQCPTPTRH